MNNSNGNGSGSGNNDKRSKEKNDRTVCYVYRGGRVHYGNKHKVKHVRMDASVHEIVFKAFYNCKQLQTIEFASIDPKIALSTSALTSSTSKSSTPTASSLSMSSQYLWLHLPFSSVTASTVTESSSSSSLTSVPSSCLTNNITTIASNAFEGCTSLTKIRLPPSIESVGCRPFDGCINLSTIILPCTLTKIWDCTFQNCAGLKEILFYDGNCDCGSYDGDDDDRRYSSSSSSSQIKEIGDHAFRDCTGLTSIDFLPPTVHKIGQHAFQSCVGLEDIYFPPPSSLSSSPSYLHPTTNSILEEIGMFAFDACSNLRSVNFSNLSKLRRIQSGTFRGCTALVSVSLPGATSSSSSSLLEVIGRSAFERCSSLTDITIPSSVRLLEEGAFEYCLNLTRVKFAPSTSTSPLSSLEEIKGRSFRCCRRLISINLPPSLKKIDSFAFASCIALETIQLPPSLHDIGKGVFGSCTSLKYVEFTQSSDGDNSDKNDDTDSVVVLPTIERLGDTAFEKCTSLQTIKLPPSLKVIGTASFQDCTSLPTLLLPPNIEEIGDMAFLGCHKLTTIQFPASLNNVLRRIGTSAFEKCKLLQEIDLSQPAVILESIQPATFRSCEALRSVKLPNNNMLKSIGESAFSGCAVLSEITLPNSIEEIHSYAFAHCGQLTTIRTTTSTNIATTTTKRTSSASVTASMIEFPNSILHLGRGVFQGCADQVKESLDVNSAHFLCDANLGGRHFLKESTGAARSTLSSTAAYDPLALWPLILRRIQVASLPLQYCLFDGRDDGYFFSPSNAPGTLHSGVRARPGRCPSDKVRKASIVYYLLLNGALG